MEKGENQIKSDDKSKSVSKPKNELMLINETFNIEQQEVISLKIVKNTKNRIKRLSNVNPDEREKEGKRLESRKYFRDHRDSVEYKKLPSGFKLIGIRANKNTLNGEVLHFCDFLIWKIPDNWPFESSKDDATRRKSSSQKLNARNSLFKIGGGSRRNEFESERRYESDNRKL